MPEPSSALNVSQDFNNPTSWNDYWDMYQDAQGYALKSKGNSGYDLVSKFLNGIDGRVDAAKGQYDQYLQELNRLFELDKINNAREWEKMMDDTKYQRMAEDLRKVGINPALIFGSGIGASGQPSFPSGSSNSHFDSYRKEKGASGAQWLSSAAMIILALARVAAL